MWKQSSVLTVWVAESLDGSTHGRFDPQVPAFGTHRSGPERTQQTMTTTDLVDIRCMHVHKHRIKDLQNSLLFYILFYHHQIGSKCKVLCVVSYPCWMSSFSFATFLSSITAMNGKQTAAINNKIPTTDMHNHSHSFPHDSNVLNT